MTKVVVVGAGGPLVTDLEERLRAALGDCRTLHLEGDDVAPFAEGGDVLVYVAPAGLGRQGTPDLEVAARVFQQASEATFRQWVLVSSAAVHVPNAHHAGHVTESQATRRDEHPIAHSWLALEEAAARAAETVAPLAILRPATLVARGGGDYVNRVLSGRWAFPLPGFDPSLQLLGVEDLTAAIVRVVEAKASGTFHVAPRGVIPLKQALRAARCIRVPMPYPMQWLARKVLAPAGLAAPIEQLDYVCHSWTVSGQTLHRQLDFAPRRSSAEAVGIANDEEFDDFGMDKRYVARLGRTLFRFLHDFWWRVEWRGLENVPRRGRAVLAGVHRGHQPWDGVMTFHLLIRELGRYARFLIHPTLVKFPFLAPYMIKCGGVHACQENADWVLNREGLLAIFPEGIRGAFTHYRDAYKLGRFGRAEYVKIALRHGAPIVPYVTVGSAEIFPIFGRIRWGWWKRYSEWPCFPITPTMGTIPLPSKWHTRFLEPVPTAGFGPEAADDPEVVRELNHRVRIRMEEAIAEMLERRKSIWWGSVFDDGEPALEKEIA